MQGKLPSKPNTNTTKKMTTEQYASAVINTARKNGMTTKQIKHASLWDLTHAHFQAQLKAIEEAGKKVLAEQTKENS